MAGGFTKEQAFRARNADLAEFLLRTDPQHYVIQGNSVRLCDPSAPRKDRIKAISIKRGVSWAYDFKIGRAMNAVQYLTDYMGYGLVDAIKALAGDETTYRQARVGGSYAQGFREQAKPPPVFPEKAPGRPRQMYAYLCSRGIPADTITSLCRLGLLYQSKDHNNLVFINGKKDYAELRGTCTYGHPFHGVVRSRPDRYWAFAIGKPQKAYVCESAIDAISLYTLLQRKHQEGGVMYVGIGGVANQQSIDAIKKNLPVIIAVDNDRAGQLCRDKNSDCEFIIPSRKDWNEDLLLGPVTTPEPVTDPLGATEASGFSELEYQAEGKEKKGGATRVSLDEIILRADEMSQKAQESCPASLPTSDKNAGRDQSGTPRRESDLPEL